MSSSFPLRKVYGPALVLAAITFGGLLSALFGDGVWDMFSWCALAVPLVVIVWMLSKTSAKKTNEPRI